MKVGYYKHTNMFGGNTEDYEMLLKCDLCGEKQFEKLYVHRLGLAVGMSGCNYTFCKKCWQSKNLGERLLKLIGFENGAYIKSDYIEMREE